MLEKLKARLAELRFEQAHAIEHRDYLRSMSLEERETPEGRKAACQRMRAEEIETVEGQVAAYQRLADMANQGKVAKTRNV